MKFPYYTKRGYPDGIYRVGPLARLNNCDALRHSDWRMMALEEFRKLQDGAPVSSSFHYHYARFVEIIYGV